MRGGCRPNSGPKPRPTLSGRPCLNAEDCIVNTRAGFVSPKTVMVNGARVGLAREGMRYCDQCREHWKFVSDGW